MAVELLIDAQHERTVNVAAISIVNVTLLRERPSSVEGKIVIRRIHEEGLETWKRLGYSKGYPCDP